MTGIKIILGSTALVSALTILAQTEFPTWIGQVGFPIAVAGFLLVEMRKEVRHMRTAFNRLSRALEKRHGIDYPTSDGED